MAHHRGLVITVVIAVVVAVVVIGVMELTTNDTDESAVDDVAAGGFELGRSVAVESTGDEGILGVGADASPNSKSTITVEAICQYGRFNCTSGSIKPLWDSWNNCVEEDYTQDVAVDGKLSYALSVTTKCFCEHSQMHWQVNIPRFYQEDYYRVQVELHEDACSGSVHAECGSKSESDSRELDCKRGRNSATVVVEAPNSR